MKVLFITSARAITDEEIEILDPNKLGGFERISSNAFVFDVSIAAATLADLQHNCRNLRIKYSLFYFDKEPVVFTSP
ncbi:hypothetical protein [Acinetobacter sp. ANC 5045]|uniref:hypothetical protein n=1 Tax=Acinetobacter sp. ANC 5045 TaxID=2529851 RepID=UPI00103FEED0|nr:hypothetical protein [Acinetobacter sp. ANC 5045]TCB16101.1 hypothetical protein E0H79_10230 [Acinetobacter sp. ANC 5045]HHW53409.1 hypothetical protein [Acinetobacter towneri]